MVASPFGGSLDTGCDSNYLRRPDGGVELLGRGSLGEVPGALPSWITAGATHVIFAITGITNCGAPIQLEPNAPPDGISAVYDRTPGGPTHVVSLLPGDVTPTESAGYTGASTDGSVVLFAFPGADPKSLYARIGNASTVRIAESGWTFAGISEKGDRVLYLQGGDVFACDLGAAGCAGPARALRPRSRPRTTSRSSTSPLTARTSIPHDDRRQAVCLGRLEHHLDRHARPRRRQRTAVNLTNWVPAGAGHENAALDPSTHDARRLGDRVRVPHARLTAYENAAHSEVYRYDTQAPPGKRLACVSCNPTRAHGGFRRPPAEPGGQRPDRDRPDPGRHRGGEPHRRRRDGLLPERRTPRPRGR